MCYIADNYYTKTYLQVKHQQHTNTTDKCMVNMAYSMMQLIQAVSKDNTGQVHRNI